MALKSIEKKKKKAAEIDAARNAEANRPSETKQTLERLRIGMLVGWLVCLAGAFAFPPLGYVFGLMLVAWIVLLFAGMFVK